MDPSVSAEVNAFLDEETSVFEGLTRRDTPGEVVHVRVEVGREKVLAALLKVLKK